MAIESKKLLNFSEEGEIKHPALFEVIADNFTILSNPIQNGLLQNYIKGVVVFSNNSRFPVGSNALPNKTSCRPLKRGAVITLKQS